MKIALDFTQKTHTHLPLRMPVHFSAIAAQSNNKSQAQRAVSSPQSVPADLPTLKHSHLYHETQGAHSYQLIY